MKIWADKKYYEKISGSEKFDHPGFLRAVELCRDAESILDVGCGDGSKLKKLGNKNTKRFGCDVSPLVKDYGFDVFDGVNLPYKNESFDRIVSFFVLEHIQKPKELIADMVRVLQKDGILILLAPNFGAPNRCSPNFEGSRIKKLFINPTWHKVTPRMDSMKDFEPDLDTTTEPFLGSAVKYLRSLKLEIVEKSSFWKLERKDAKIIQKIFRLLREDWGPHLFVIAKKAQVTP